MAPWRFGQLIGNAGLRDGNLSFRPGLQSASSYDMLQAPPAGVERPDRRSAPPLLSLRLAVEGTAPPGRWWLWQVADGRCNLFSSWVSTEVRISAGCRQIAGGPRPSRA